MAAIGPPIDTEGSPCRAMPMRDLDLNLLVALDVLLQERHVTRAAERLGMSQSSMSTSLARLRETFGDEILMRAPGGLVPTPRAEALQPLVRRAVDSATDVFARPPDFAPASARHEFRLIVIDYIDLLLVPALLARVRAEAPGVRVRILQPNPHHFGEAMAAGELDLALSYFPHAPEYLKARRLFDDRFAALCRVGHPALGRDLDAAAFCALPHVTIEPEASQIYNVLIDAALEPLGLGRNVRVVKPSFLALPWLIERTDLIACIPARLAQRMRAMAAVTTLAMPMELPVFEVQMLWHPRTDRSGPHAWLRSLVLDVAREAG